MFEFLKKFSKKLISSRLFVLSVVMIGLFAVLFQRIFVLQIINGEEYLDNYTLRIQKERITSGTRGSIYDRNGKLLAYNELSYSVTIEDNGIYSSNDEKNRKMNEELHTVIHMIEDKGDTITNTFSIVKKDRGAYEFNLSGKALKRFLADVYGHTKTDDLKYNKRFKHLK